MLDDSANGVREAFAKQRRNLLVLSLFLFALDFAGASLPKAINAGGFQLSFTEPERIEILMWAVLMYFVIRYYQYLPASEYEKSKSAFPLDYDVAILAFNKIMKFPGALDRPDINSVLQKMYHLNDFSRESAKKHFFFWQIPLELQFVGPTDLDAVKRIKIDYRFPRKYFFHLEIRRWIKILIKTPFGTEYFAPVILPILAATYHLILNVV